MFILRNIHCNDIKISQYNNIVIWIHIIIFIVIFKKKTNEYKMLYI